MLSANYIILLLILFCSWRWYVAAMHCYNNIVNCTVWIANLAVSSFTYQCRDFYHRFCFPSSCHEQQCIVCTSAVCFLLFSTGNDALCSMWSNAFKISFCEDWRIIVFAQKLPLLDFLLFRCYYLNISRCWQHGCFYFSARQHEFLSLMFQ